MENQKYKILIVEDNPVERDLNKFVLEDAGFIVFTATNAAETLSVLDSNCPEQKACYDYTCKTGKCFDAVLMDYDLPDIKGGTLAGWIRTKFNNIALLIYTGYGRLPTIVKQANDIGAELLTKPLAPDELSKAVINQIKTKVNRDASGSFSPVSTSSVRHILSIASLGRRHQTN